MEWLKAKEQMAPDLLQEAKERLSLSLKPRHYIDVATALPSKYELQRQVIKKAEKEELSLK
ncbi:hypothetical protein M1N58_02985 [Dehalococcoidales bacterium]|nr:hypothetical protein [Dehalococcoidales bacterium]